MTAEQIAERLGEIGVLLSGPFPDFRPDYKELLAERERLRSIYTDVLEGRA